MSLDKTYLVPGVFVTLDNTLANTSGGETFKTVIVGQKTSAGTATADVLTRVYSQSDAQAKGGVGSMLDEMFTKWFDGNVSNEVYMIAMDDAAASVAMSSEQYFEAPQGSGLAEESATVALYINGNRVAVGVSPADSNYTLVTALISLVNADTSLPVTATAPAGNILALTAKNKGATSNDIDIRYNIADGEGFPVGIALGALSVTAGATDPDIADAIAGLPDDLYNLIVNPYTDATNIATLKTELDRRWGNLVQLDGHAISSFGGTTSTVVTKGEALNSENLTLMDSGADNQTPAYLNCCAVAAQVAGSASVDPARPFRTLPLVNVDGDTPSDKRTKPDRNAILVSGVSTHTIANDGTVYIERLRTTYKTNALGAPDNSYQNTNTMLNLSYIRQSFINFCLSQWPRHKIASDGFTIKAGQPIATPSSVKGTLVTQWYQGLIDLGLAEDLEGFAEAITVEIDSVNKSRMNVYTKPDLIGQFYQIDNTLQFVI